MRWALPLLAQQEYITSPALNDEENVHILFNEYPLKTSKMFLYKYVVYGCSYRRIHFSYTKERSKAVYAVSLKTNQYKSGKTSFLDAPKNLLYTIKSVVSLLISETK